ncbi:MAG: hypothetical protein IPL75_23900 [Acidobacteria bacterium]|nr:hypothetical protein [Acidobacteriota bacterium]
MKSTDYGATWTSVVGNVPSGSINVIREDPSVEGLLSAGNDFGAYVSKDAGLTWHVLGETCVRAGLRPANPPARPLHRHCHLRAWHGVMDGRRVR